jgi:chemotaxis response regulator CheB
MAQQLAGKQILIVERSYLMARHIATVLAAHGMVVLGPVNSAADARRVVQRSRTDGVVLDATLGSEAWAPLVTLLRQRGIPMLVVGRPRHDPAPKDLAARRPLAMPAVMNGRKPGKAFAPPRAGHPTPPRVSDADLISRSRRAIEDSYELLARVRELEAKQARVMRQWRLQRQGRSFADLAAQASEDNLPTDRERDSVTVSEPEACSSPEYRRSLSAPSPAADEGTPASWR